VLFIFPSRYWSTIGHQGVFRLRRWSSRIHTEFHGLRATWEHAWESRRFHVRGYHPLCRRFPPPSATRAISHSLPDQQLRPDGPATPVTQRLQALTRNRFSLFPFRSPLLRESRLLSLPAGTEMFHFPALPPPALCVQAGVTANYGGSGFPIRKSPDQRLVADSPGLIAAACTARTWHPVNGVTFGPFAPRRRFYPASDQSAGARPLSRSGRNPFLDTAFRSPAATIHLAVNHHGRVNVPGLHLRNDSEIFLCPFGFELPPPFGFLWPLRGALNA